MNKRGFELVWSNVVLMIIGIMILIFLVLFFTGFSGDFLGKIKGYFSSSNVDAVVEGCNIFVEIGSQYSYCCEKKKVVYFEDKKKVSGDYTCGELFGMDFINDKINELDCGNVKC